MIDERSLRDPTRCPSCSASLPPGPTACSRCHMPLTGETATAVWTASLAAAAALAERARLVDILRAQAGVRSEVPAPTATGPEAAAQSLLRRARPEWSRSLVKSVLLTLGVLLLAVAAIVFLFVAWQLIGRSGRALALGAITISAAVGARSLWHRRLIDTAEAVGLLAIVLAVLDAAGARWSGLAGADHRTRRSTGRSCSLCSRWWPPPARGGCRWSRGVWRRPYSASSRCRCS